jgi:dihydrofolate reductase
MNLENNSKIIIAAVSENFVIGERNRMPWHIPEELKLFKQITWGNTVLMGRATFDSLSAPLPGRVNIVVSRSKLSHSGILVAKNIREAFQIANKQNRPLFIIGGASIYEQTIDEVEYMFLSHIKGEYSGDKFFPKFDWNDWQILQKQNYPQFDFVVYKRARI